MSCVLLAAGPLIVLFFVIVGVGATSPADYALGLVTAYLALALLEATDGAARNPRTGADHS